jgi:hypothetical protein
MGASGGAEALGWTGAFGGDTTTGVEGGVIGGEATKAAEAVDGRFFRMITVGVGIGETFFGGIFPLNPSYRLYAEQAFPFPFFLASRT